MPTLVFLLDVDNTLLDNDHIKQIWDESLQTEVGPELTARFWDIYEQVRHEKSVIDIPLALLRFREAIPLSNMDEQTYEHVHSLFDNYQFFQALYPHVLETLHYLRTMGLTIVVSDGDMCFQAEKIFNSDLAATVEGRVLIYVHKQEHLDEVMRLYPADQYVMVDDKPDILADSIAVLGNRLTTVFVQQGKYAKSPLPDSFVPDITVEHIGDLRHYGAEQFFHPYR